MYNAVDGPSSGPILFSDTMFTVNNLNEYTEYEFRIAAATSAGLGPDRETSNTTAEDGTYMCVWAV